MEREPSVKQAPVLLQWPAALRWLLCGLIVLGVVSFFWQLQHGLPAHAWSSLQVNFLFWFGISAAAGTFAAVFHLAGAVWPRPLLPLFQAAIPLLLMMSVFILVLLFGAENLFSWAVEPIHGKESWLTLRAVYLRDVLGALILTAFVFSFYSLSRSSAPRTAEKLSRLAPPTVLAYVVVMSLIAFDQSMSVDPHWYSTLFGVFYFMSAVYAAFALVAMLAAVASTRDAGITPAVLHDLGKLLFGFGIFWAYLFWSHYLPIWYGNIPEETGWLVLRTRMAPWHDLAWIAFGAAFFIPFMIGLNRDLKRRPALLFGWGLIVLCGLWLSQYLLFVPTLFPHEIPLNLWDAGIAAGFAALYALSAERFIAQAHNSARFFLRS